MFIKHFIIFCTILYYYPIYKIILNYFQELKFLLCTKTWKNHYNHLGEKTQRISLQREK